MQGERTKMERKGGKRRQAKGIKGIESETKEGENQRREKEERGGKE